MKPKTTHIRTGRARTAAHMAACILLCMCAATSCHIDGTPEPCAYDIKLVYRYSRDMKGTANHIGSHIGSMKEYLFDEDGVLYAVSTLPGKSCMGYNVSEHSLPSGKYTVVSWGNINGSSHIDPMVPGLSTLDDMSIMLNAPSKNGGDGEQTYKNSERLYYGYRTFRVNDNGISRINVDMAHAYCRLGLTIGWNSTPPENTRDFNILYRNIPAGYGFTPDYIIDREEWRPYLRRESDYPAICADFRYYPPEYDGAKTHVTHRADVTMNVDKKIKTELITYRHGDEPLLLSLYAGDRQIMKEIDLQYFFTTMGVQLSRHPQQEFDLRIDIDGDSVTVGFMSVTDWDEGGSIGGKLI